MSSVEFKYDDSKLRDIWEQLSPDNRKKALHRAFGKTASNYHKAVKNKIRDLMGESGERLDDGVRKIVYDRAMGFRVTVGPAGATKKSWVSNGEKVYAYRKGFHLNRWANYVPVLVWAEDGTRARSTKDGSRRRAGRRRKAHPTGSMKAYKFMLATEREREQNVTADMQRAIKDYVVKVGKKNNCV